MNQTSKPRTSRQPFPAAAYVPGIPLEERSGVVIPEPAGKWSKLSGAPRLVRLVLVAVVVMSVIGVVEVLYRRSGGLPTVVPGLTQVEYEWKVAHLPSRDLTIVIGDSRMGWGFSETDFLEGSQVSGGSNVNVRHVANLGAPGHSTEDLVRYVLRFGKPCVGCEMVIGYTPAGFYSFAGDWRSTGKARVTLQELLDDRIHSVLAERLYTSSKDWHTIAATIWHALRGRRDQETTFIDRTEYPGHFFNAGLGSSKDGPIDPSQFQLDNYGRIILKTLRDSPEGGVARRDALLSALAEAGRLGWKVSLVRFPIGDRMRILEKSIVPAALEADSIAKTAGVPFIDYDVDPRALHLPTIDESHLTPQSARRVSWLFGKDLASRP